MAELLVADRSAFGRLLVGCVVQPDSRTDLVRDAASAASPAAASAAAAAASAASAASSFTDTAAERNELRAGSLQVPLARPPGDLE